VDLDGDGIADVLSGSWPGELYFFKGLGKGKYAAARKLEGKDGKAIKLGPASTAFAADWRGTGKLDLLVGSIEGHVWLVPNEGTKGKPAYGKAVKLSAAGAEIRVNHGDSHPVMADWEGTGKPGLIVGCGDGSVLWFRNEGTRAEPKLARAVTLVAAPPPAGRADAKPGPGPQHGTRAKVWVGDWNGDGKLDLLVGDFSTSSSPAPKLTDADRQRQKELQAKLTEISKELQPYFREISALHEKGVGKTPEARAELRKKVAKIAEKYRKPLDEQRKVVLELHRSQPSFQHHGHVWLYLRKPAEATAAR
jgi:hypothetical protein